MFHLLSFLYISIMCKHYQYWLDQWCEFKVGLLSALSGCYEDLKKHFCNSVLNFYRRKRTHYLTRFHRKICQPMGVMLTLTGLWHTPAASLGFQLCDTGLLVPVQPGSVQVRGADRWLEGEEAGHNVEHWDKESASRFGICLLSQHDSSLGTHWLNILSHLGAQGCLYCARLLMWST